jgi:hypothetical protein
MQGSYFGQNRTPFPQQKYANIYSSRSFFDFIFPLYDRYTLPFTYNFSDFFPISSFLAHIFPAFFFLFHIFLQNFRTS